ncbi:hypothetical protein NOF55_18585 [Rhizobiaceae bacterium BDR2-2]|uniref:Uncharacterized protein n=2 Tax=Ectorhizobium quercum TaxID=2965071 RepID=A0AAE3N2R2_9HYPH|nr:hypothetical protein [Ectorhizobium quercum]
MFGEALHAELRPRNVTVRVTFCHGITSGSSNRRLSVATAGCGEPWRGIGGL